MGRCRTWKFEMPNIVGAPTHRRGPPLPGASPEEPTGISGAMALVSATAPPPTPAMSASLVGYRLVLSRLTTGWNCSHARRPKQHGPVRFQAQRALSTLPAVCTGLHNQSLNTYLLSCHGSHMSAMSAPSLSKSDSDTLLAAAESH